MHKHQCFSMCDAGPCSSACTLAQLLVTDQHLHAVDAWCMITALQVGMNLSIASMRPPGAAWKPCAQRFAGCTCFMTQTLLFGGGCHPFHISFVHIVCAHPVRRASYSLQLVWLQVTGPRSTALPLLCRPRPQPPGTHSPWATGSSSPRPPRP